LLGLLVVCGQQEGEEVQTLYVFFKDLAEVGVLSAEVRRVVVSKSFETIFDAKVLTSNVTDGHPLYSVVPASGKRMSFDREVVLADRNCDERICTAEAFNTKHQVLVLIRDSGLSKKCSIVVPASYSLKQLK
jgi:hypothetical protein